MAPTTRTLALLSLIAAGACGPEKSDDTTGSTMTAGDSSGGQGTEPITSSDPTTGGEPLTTSDPTSPTTTTEGTATQTTDPTTPTTMTSMTGGDDAEICANLGGQAGVDALIGDFVGRVLVDERINAYFLTTEVDGARLVDCLAQQLGEATGCAGTVYTCMDMKTAHAGMGISMSDFNDLAEDFSQALDAHQAANPNLGVADKTTILGVLASMAPDIVEDPNNNITVYQRLGRKPGLNTVVGGPGDPLSFIGVVASDVAINGFFTTTDVDRLRTCLVRQLTEATSGPQIYGKEVSAPAPADPGVSAEDPCRDMKSSHAMLKDANDKKGVEFEDFVALVGDLVTALNNYGVPETEQNAILGALGPLCPEIVTVDPEMCG